jgi:hypothetical protein
VLAARLPTFVTPARSIGQASFYPYKQSASIGECLFRFYIRLVNNWNRGEKNAE